MMVLSQDRTLLVDVEGVMIDPEFSGNIVSTSTDPVSGFRYFLASYDDEKTAKHMIKMMSYYIRTTGTRNAVYEFPED